MFIGMIDGDGCIFKKHNRNCLNIVIKCHSSWINFYKLIDDKLFDNTNTIKINSRGYMEYRICKKINVEKKPRANAVNKESEHTFIFFIELL